MNIKLDDLQTMVKELTETYFGTSSTQSGLSSTAFNKVGPADKSGPSDIPFDPVDLSIKIRALIGGDAGYPIGDWGDEQFNDAAAACADALIGGYDPDSKRRQARMFQEVLKEEIENFIKENELDSRAAMAVFDKMVKILDSMDMSLDLIYGALSGGDAPIALTRARQKQLGRAMIPVTRPAPSE